MGFFLLLFIVICLFICIPLFLYPTPLIYQLKKWGHWIIEHRFHLHQSLKVSQLAQNNQENLFYNKVCTYVNSLTSIEDSDFTCLFSGKKPTDIVMCLDDDQTVQDTFLGARVFWTNRVERIEGKNLCVKTFVLKVKKRDKRRILQSYLQHIYRVAEDIESRCKEVKLYMNSAAESDDHCSKGRWRSVRFTHPSTFETIAMDSDLKNKVKSNLESFLKSEQYYHRLGRVWKRSYLLYGPSGTGKSSFVAAMAKFLSYDVYDIDLSKVIDDSDLKMLLLQTRSKSLIVVEDLDRFITSNSTTVSLSGILNFMDGILNSCCGDEKVTVYTMNSKEKIEPAILRPGRIDVHIYFPLCNFNSFKTLASNYLGLKDHKLFLQVEEIFQSGATMSPAEMSELMISNRGSPSRALRSVISALQKSGEARLAASAVGGKSGRRLHQEGVAAAEEESSSSLGETCRDSSSVPGVKEMQKLYGVLKMRSGKKVEASDSGFTER